MREASAGIPAGSDVIGTVWRAPSNIALIKYWGKTKGQVPRNPSLSFSLDRSFTEMKMTAELNTKKPGVFYSFEGRSQPAFAERILKYLEGIKGYFPFLAKSALHIESHNTFPHSSGIASSASSMAQESSG